MVYLVTPENVPTCRVNQQGSGSPAAAWGIADAIAVALPQVRTGSGCLFIGHRVRMGIWVALG